MLALHVHHGLSPNADAWLAHCTAQCNAWAGRGHALTFEARQLVPGRGAGESVEAWARQRRYEALRQMAVGHGALLVLLAHHRRDQAETFLLQALRGGGVAGLAAMPATAEREGVIWSRPWIDMPAEAIERYARANALIWVEDESNHDPGFARNRLRAAVWPALVAAFPQAEQSLASAARWAGEAAETNAETARADLCGAGSAQALDLHVWHALPVARRSNALRAWLRAAAGRAAPASLVTRLLIELEPEGVRQWPLKGGVLRSYRGRLVWSPAPSALPGSESVTLDARQPGRYRAPPWQGELVVEAVEHGGLAIANASAIELTQRRPDDRFRAHADRPARSLKLQFQAAGIAAFERQGPVVRSGGRLVFVPGLGLDASAVAAPGEPQVSLSWCPGADGVPTAEDHQGAG